MEHLVIKRQGGYLYARSFRTVVLFLTLVYGAIGVALVMITESYQRDDVLSRIVLPVVAFIPVLVMWLAYGATLWALKREARHTIELSDEGIRETKAGRDHRFIPWAGVREIEMSADLFGGMSLKVKGAFLEITISNVDLEITTPMSMWKMNRALTRAHQMKKLLDKLRAAMPQADLKMNKLAQRRINQLALASTDSASRR